MLDKMLQRQSDLIPVSALGSRITIVGAGAVGSWTALALAKMGFLNLRVIDYDEIDIANMNCQFYPVDKVGSKKVLVLRDMIKEFTGYEIEVADAKWDGQNLDTDILVAAVDNMQVRHDLFHKSGPRTKYFIDPRMGAETMHLYTYRPNEAGDQEEYGKSWYSDDDAVHERCTAKSTIYCANLLSGLVAKTVKNLACKQNHIRVLRWDLKTNHMENYSREA